MKRYYLSALFVAASGLLPHAAQAPLYGTAVQQPAPGLTVTPQLPQMLRFPSVAVGAQTAPKRIRLYNPGSVNTALSSVIAPAGFKITSNSCAADNPAGAAPPTTGVVKPGSSCSIWVNFAPQSASSFNNRVEIASSAGTFFVTVTGLALTDTDGDGIPDEWEVGPTTIQGETINLAAMGATVGIKDIFVQLDYFQDGTHSHQPNLEAITKVVNAFWRPHVLRPGGPLERIALHVDCGEDCPMDPDPANPIAWGTLSRSRALPHVDSFGTFANGKYHWGQFDAIRLQSLSPARSVTFRYGIFVHSLTGLADTTGLSRTGSEGDRKTASHFLVSLGATTNMVGNVAEQAGTFMHELGHNLGLTHGGCVAGPPLRCEENSYKPNYLSVMNYFFQLRGLFANGEDAVMEYSATALSNLNEIAGLAEGNGIGVGGQNGTRYFCPGPDDVSDTFVSPANSIDWDCDGTPGELTTDADVDNSDGKQVINGAGDWPYLAFVGGAIGQAGVAPPFPPETPVDELTMQQDKRISTIRGVSIITGNSLGLTPGATGNVTFTVLNRGIAPETFKLTFTPTPTIAPWVKAVGLPKQITLPRGGKQVISVGVTALSAGFGEMALRATSISSPGVFDVSRVAITSGLADLSLSVSDAPDPLIQGDQLTYTAMVHNLSSDVARHVEVTADLPALGGITTVGGVCIPTRPFVCTLGDLNPGQSIKFSIRGIPRTIGVLRAVFHVKSATPDLNTTNNVGAVTTSVRPILPAPVQLSPANNRVLSAYPRTTVLTWAPVSGALTYGVEIDCFGCCRNSQWCSEVGGATQSVQGLSTPTYTFNFDGVQGRWRVWATHNSGRRGAVSDWWVFRYTK
jgi:hypothetical protein